MALIISHSLFIASSSSRSGEQLFPSIFCVMFRCSCVLFFTDVHSRTSCCWVMPAVLHPSIRGWNVACAFAQNVFFFCFFVFFYFISRFFLFVTNGIGRCAQPQTAATSQHRISTVVVTFFFFSLSFVIHHQHFFTSTWVFFFFLFLLLFRWDFRLPLIPIP